MQPVEGFRLSPQQKRVWQLQAEQHVTYRATGVVLIDGPLRPAALEAALQQVVDQNEILRTSFQRLAGMALPVQVIADQATATLKQHDLGDCPPDQQAARLHALLDQLGEQHRDLQHAPLLACALARLGPQRHALLLSLPTLCADAATIGNLARAISRAYAGGAPDDEATQYADIAELFNELLDGDDTESGRAYWHRQDLAQPSAALPLERPAPPTAFAPLSLPVAIDPQLAERIAARAEQQGTAVETLLLAGWQILLARLSGQDAIVVGTSFDGRTYEGLDVALGLFARYLPVRCQLGDGATLRTVAEQIDRATQEITELQEYFSWDLYAPKAAELPSLAFNFDCARVPGVLTAGDLKLTIQRQHAQIERFKLRLSCALRDQSLEIALHYDSASYAVAEAQQLAERFVTLFGAALDQPETPIGALPLVSAGERRRLTVELNATQANVPQERCVHQLFEEQAARTPAAMAVIFGDEQLSYAELNARANQLARHLIQRGVGPDVPVALCLDRSADMIVGVLGILKAGGAYVPLDPSYPAERLAFVLRDARAPVLVTQERLRERFGTALSGATIAVYLDTDWPAIADAPAENNESRASADNAAYIIYTSGSTGVPKGVVVQHRSVVNLLVGLDQAVYDGSGTAPLRISMNGPLVFDTSVKQLVQLLRGHALVIVPDDLRLDAQAIADFLQQQRVDVFDCTPSLLKALLSAGTLGEYPTRVLIGGEAIDDALWQTLVTHADRRFYNLYGPTECTVDATISRIDRAAATPTIGRPVANTAVYLLDPQQQLVPFGLPGEICIGGAGLARGYLGRPDLTAERFVPDPFGGEPGARLYRTGDLARYRANGALEYGGRIDDQVKLRGYRIELGEIAAVLREHPAVQDAAVIVRSDQPDQQRLVAYVVPDPQTAFTVRQLLRMERAGLIDRRACYDLPNAMLVAQVNKNETEFLYKEIFEEQTYLRHGITLGEHAVVFDVGANIGMFALFVGQRCPNATIYAFEPIPKVFDVLRTNAQLYDFNITPLQYGLSDAAKAVTFTYYPHASTMSGRYVDADEEQAVIRSLVLTQEQGDGAPLDSVLLDQVIAERLTSEQVVCELTTVSAMIRQHGLERIDLLKIDAQKSELDVLQGIAPQDWPKIQQIVLEVHDIAGRVDQIKALLADAGYVVAVEQEEAMIGTPLYDVYARRQEDHAPVPTPQRQRWTNPNQLTGDLRRGLGERLPEYMVPAAFVLLEALPLTTNGKLDRRTLPEPEQARAGAEHSFVAPRTPTEALLAQIWSDLLQVERIGIDDNFFELGGDSILCIQVVARANAAGLTLAPRQLFAHQTIAALAAVVGAPSAGLQGQAARGPLAGPLPLLPIQRWFFEQDWPDPRAWNQIIALELRQPITTAQLGQALAALVQHHDGLRLRFTHDHGWRQEIAAPGMPPTLLSADLSGVPAFAQAREIARITVDLNAQVDLGAGVLLHAALIERGADQPTLLLLASHALAMDGFSRRILADDLQTACQQVLDGVAIQLPPPTTSLARWVEALTEYAHGDALQQEHGYWLDAIGTDDFRLPRDLPNAPPAASAPEAVLVELDAEETRALLQDVPAAYRTEINDVLLAALAEAFRRWTGRPMRLDLRGHGREPIFDEIDLSRTVGWLTSIFPVLLDLGDAEGPGAQLLAIKEQLRQIPNHGVGYGVLRYLGDADLAEQLQALPQAEVSFNYLGQFDQALPELFALARDMSDPSGGLWSPRYLLEIQGGVVGGQLRLAWKYSPDHHYRHTIERLAADFMAALRALIAHCQSPDAGGYTPSDFPLANLNQQALDAILAQVRKPQGNKDAQ